MTTASVAAGAALLPQPLRASFAAPPVRYSFVLLGDLHFDKLEHHDMAWVKKDKPNDVRQIEGYSRNTREVTPRLLQTVRETVAELNREAAYPVAFILQAGDLVEGLCGSEELSVWQNTEALDFVRAAELGAPLLFTKGNHDVTGPGAVAAFGSVFHPFLTEQARRVNPMTAEVKSGSYNLIRGNAQFAFFDAYEATKSLEWFEAVAAKRTVEHFFVVIHPPVVPYGARSTWHIFSNAKEVARREKLLTLLGDNEALVIGGHIHRFNTLSRRAGKGRFAQLAVSSVLTAPTVKAKDVLTGVERYAPDQISVEPKFSPENAELRRVVYEEERKFIGDFEYADLPGYAVVKVDGPKVGVQMYAGASRELWRSVDFSALAKGRSG
ncbi:MAG: metallophosphoesterase [Verrucomicrobiota bacterium]